MPQRPKQDPEIKAQNEFIHNAHKEERARGTLLEEISIGSLLKMKEKDTFSYVVTSVLCFAEMVTDEPDPFVFFVHSFPANFSSCIRAALGTFCKAIRQNL